MVARHDKYYFEDGNVVFQVGETLFRIHKRLLVGSESSVFASMFSIPQSEAVEGQTDERPIVLKGDSVKQFEALMKILYPSLLENVLNIPIVTYARAMRIAVKYAMDDVQVAIAQLIPLQPQLDLGTAIFRLAFVAEFQSHFTRDVAIKVFTHASSIDHHPTADHLGPLMPYPAFVAIMMRYREGLRNQDTSSWSKLGYGSDYWLNQEFGRFGFITPVPEPLKGPEFDWLRQRKY